MQSVARLLAVAIVVWGALQPAFAQERDWDPGRFYATRQALQELLARYEGAAESPAYSRRTRARASQDALRIRARLDHGDFQTGDRIFLSVEGETILSDTFTVATGPDLMLPTVGTVSLQGVLRAELQDYLVEEISRFIRDPVVQTSTLIRVSITGEVSAPGFYVVPTEGLITDALMLAGGPTRDAELTEIRVERGNQTIWASDDLETAIIEGQTLDQINLRAGDRIVVPGRGGGIGGAEGAVRTLALIMSIPLTIFAVTQIFR